MTRIAHVVASIHPPILPFTSPYTNICHRSWHPISLQTIVHICWVLAPLPWRNMRISRGFFCAALALSLGADAKLFGKDKREFSPPDYRVFFLLALSRRRRLGERRADDWIPFIIFFTLIPLRSVPVCHSSLSRQFSLYSRLRGLVARSIHPIPQRARYRDQGFAQPRGSPKAYR